MAEVADERAGRHGATVPRGQAADPPRGRFGRMFPALQPCDIGDEAIEALAEWIGSAERPPSPENHHIPAGYTYLGQFVDHDITFDPTSSLDRLNDPHALVNFRTPRLDLDSVYGAGPVAQPFLYDKSSRELRLLVGDKKVRDLPRNQQDRALIGDARNDENAIVAQLHLLFIRFHNTVVDELIDERQVPEGERFEAAQRIVRWHYQWIVLHDFLERVVGEQMAKAALSERRFFRWRREPFIPVEFSGAAYRFGHSMVRARYSIKRRAEGVKTLQTFPLFPDLEGRGALEESHVIDWERFFELPRAPGQPRVQPSLAIDTRISAPLMRLPEGDPVLPRRNLLRGRALGLPSGQDIACVMHEPPLTEEQLQLDEIDNAKLRDEIRASTPLWYYILCEAASERGGSSAHLGPVGGRIVAEVLAGLVEGDPQSYLNLEPNWQPSELGGDFTMADLVTFVEEAEARHDGA